MPFSLRLPPSFSQAGWKVKIREKETREPPHVTVLRKTDAWRIDLRTGKFMDQHPDPLDVPQRLLDHIRSKDVWKKLRGEWDKKYPNNPVGNV